VPTVAVIVWVAPEAAVPAISEPFVAVEQVKLDTTDEPLDVGLGAFTVLLKLQFGVVLIVKLDVPDVAGVPVAVRIISWAPVPAKVPEPVKVTPPAVAEMLYVPTVPTVAVMVWVTPVTAVPEVIVPAEALLQL